MKNVLRLYLSFSTALFRHGNEVPKSLYISDTRVSLFISTYSYQ